jgi:acetone carboxylase gamma subunit
MSSYDDRTITQLIDGELDWPKMKEIISNPKDPARFE